jgi:hypothetical protein
MVQVPSLLLILWEQWCHAGMRVPVLQHLRLPLNLHVKCMRLWVMDILIIQAQSARAPMCMLVLGNPFYPNPHQTVEKNRPSLSRSITWNHASFLKLKPSLRHMLRLWEKCCDNGKSMNSYILNFLGPEVCSKNI